MSYDRGRFVQPPYFVTPRAYFENLGYKFADDAAFIAWFTGSVDAAGEYAQAAAEAAAAAGRAAETAEAEKAGAEARAQDAEAAAGRAEQIAANHYETVDARLDAQDTEIAGIRASVSNPFVVAATGADMTDTTKAYVYVGDGTGADAGLEFGAWYFWDGTEWVRGGTETDPTLTQEGVPAEARAAGDKINALGDEINLVETNLDHCNAGYSVISGSQSTTGFYRIASGRYTGEVGQALSHEGDGKSALTYHYLRVADKSVLTLDDLFDVYQMQVRVLLPGTQDPDYTVRYVFGMNKTPVYINPKKFGSAGDYAEVYVAINFKRIDNAPMGSSDYEALGKGLKIRLTQSSVRTFETCLVPGALMINTGKLAKGHSDLFFRYHTSKYPLHISGCSRVSLILDTDRYEEITAGAFYFYRMINGEVIFNRRVQFDETRVSGQNTYSCYVASDDEYLLIGVDVPNSPKDDIPVTIECYGEVVNARLTKFFNNPNDEDVVMSYNYRVSESFTSGRLVLPPNYTLDGPPVPVIVLIHGTGGMVTWDDRLLIQEEHDLTDIINYCAAEGFALFDCYPWTDKYYSDSRQISPYCVWVHERAYVEGIKYICDRWNIDINNVFLRCKSLGGNLGYWFMHQTELPVRGIAMLAPSTGFASTIWSQIFLEKNARRNIVTLLGLEDDPDAETFINTGLGLKNTICMNFMRRNIEKFSPLICGAIATFGPSMEEKFDNMVEGEKTEPQWMIDKNIPMWPAAWNNGNNATGVPSLVNHPEYFKYTPYPVAYWAAFDDINTSTHANYTVYQWLLNAGSNAAFHILPNNTGGHWAMDLSENAIKTSGTTRLGIAYSDIAQGTVDMINWFYELMIG